MTEERDKIKVILCKPDERAEIVEIEDKLEAMQELVGGYIVHGKMNLPSCGKEFFLLPVSRFFSVQ